ncbi:hypothetical protein SO802_005010 [Lithocarpus litseifolius]|uniref:Apple domain-containing protein n=1 Tax=Lithocarpus litseifolius TaxID=425828 RepID=A0AAW2DJD3_9ROSI
MNNSIEEGKADGFLKLEMIKVPDFAELALDANIEDCRKHCLENFSCVAYGYYTGIGCEKGRRIRELTSVVQKRFKFPENSVELYSEKVNNRGLCAIAQAESLHYKLLGGFAVRSFNLLVFRACYGVLRFVMESGAKGCEVIVSGKLRAQRAKAMKFKDGYMISSGQPVNEYIDSAVRHVLLRQARLRVLGIKVKIMLDWDPKGKVCPITPLPDLVTIHSPKEEEEYNFTPTLAASNIEIAAV